MSATGSITIRNEDRFFTLHLEQQGWLAAEMVVYLEDVLEAATPELEILKLLGYTMEIGAENPPRKAHHWVEVDLADRLLRTNSGLLRKAVDQLPPGPEDPYAAASLKRLYRFLDRYDFTVEFFT